jgi:hypothetical protein
MHQALVLRSDLCLAMDAFAGSSGLAGRASHADLGGHEFWLRVFVEDPRSTHDPAVGGVLGRVAGYLQGFEEVVQLLLIGHRGIRFASLYGFCLQVRGFGIPVDP